MKNYYALFFVAAFWVLLAAPAYAENSYRFELFAGASIPVDKDFRIGLPQSTIPLRGEFTVSPGGLGGVRVGVDG
jgi:hypothetical protein